MRQGSSRGVWRLAAALGLGATMVSTGCGGFFLPVKSNPGSGSSSFVYATNAGGTLTEYSLTSGVLAALSGSPITVSIDPTCIAIAPNNAFLYVGTATGVFLYTIGSDGTLTEGNNDTVVYLNQKGYSVASMVVDPTSSWLIMAYQNQTDVDALPVSPTTGLANSTVVDTTNTTFGTQAPKLAISPANNNIFVALGSGGTNAFGFNPSATSNGPFGSRVPIPLGTKIASASDTGVAVDPTSTYLYITEADLATPPGPGSLRLFKISNLGAELTGSPYTTGIGPSSVLADTSGKYVYVTNSTDNTISGFAFTAATQTLAAIGSSPYPTAKAPQALVEDSSKTYVMSIGSGANPNLWLYSFDTTAADGTLDITSSTSTASVSPAASNGIVATH
jgi:6-phosphogluconolactonase